MAYTLTSGQIDDAVATTLTYRLPTLIDNVYVSGPLLKMLDMQDRITADGGTQIEQPILYAKGPGGSYSGLDTMDTVRRKTKSLLQFPWKQYYATVTVDGLTRLQASGYNAVIDLVDSELMAAELRLKDDMGADLYLDGTGNNSKTLTGLDLAIATTGTYGGIARATDAEGTAIRGNVDSVGGSTTLPVLQALWGLCVFGNEHPNLITCPQAIFDAIWMRLQPQQRYPTGPVAEQIAKAGFTTITFNNVPVTVDQKATAGTLWMLNTNFLKLVAHEQRQNIETEGPLVPPNQDAKVWKLMWAGNIVCGGPRFCGKATGLT